MNVQVLLDRVDEKQRNAIVRAQREIPVRIGSLARDLGAIVRVANLGSGVSGQVSRENDQYTIRVHRHEAKERQRFTVAHELSHLLLHRHIIDASEDGIKDNVLYRSGKPERIEYEANSLAAELVMPADRVRERLVVLGGEVNDRVIEELASEFEVSRAAMEIRLSTI